MYENFFRLSDQPFRLSPDHRFFYQSGVHRRALAHLKFGLDQSEGFILITGEVGAGKTTLVDHLLATLNPRQFVAANIVTSNLDQDNMIRMIASSFGLTQEGLNKTSIFRNLERFLADQARQGRRCLLFVDEAQNLSISALEELRMLSNLQVGGRPALQSFLLGQPQFRQTLARDDLAQLRQRVIASFHLGPLDREELGQYIVHRLEVVGWDKDPIFSYEAINVIYDFTSGIPRRVNTLCNRLMLDAYLSESHRIEADDVRRVESELEAELNQVMDADSRKTIEVPEKEPAPLQKPVATATLPNRPLPHVQDEQPVIDFETLDAAAAAADSGDHSIPAFHDEGHEAEVIDLTIHAPDDSTLENEERVKTRALHTVINFFGGRAR